MFCMKCGNELNDNVLFCNRCGASVSMNDAKDPAVDLANQTVQSTYMQPNITRQVGSPRFTKAMFLCGMIFGALYFLIALFSSFCGRIIANQYAHLDFSEIDFGYTVPYSSIFVGLFELIVFVLMFVLITKQLREKKHGIAVEILFIIYGTVVRFVVNSMLSSLRTTAYVEYMNKIMQDADATHMSLIQVAYNAMCNWYAMIAILSSISIAFVLVGCGASIATKQSIRQSKHPML